jgi:hypothetical protein
MSITGQANALGLLLAQPVVEQRHALLRTVFAAEPDRAPSNQVAHHDAVGVADRDFVDADRLGTGRASLGQLRPHVLHLQSLDRLPVKPEFLGNVRGPAEGPMTKAYVPMAGRMAYVWDSPLV